MEGPFSYLNRVVRTPLPVDYLKSVKQEELIKEDPATGCHVWLGDLDDEDVPVFHHDGGTFFVRNLNYALNVKVSYHRVAHLELKPTRSCDAYCVNPHHHTQRERERVRPKRKSRVTVLPLLPDPLRKRDRKLNPVEMDLLAEERRKGKTYQELQREWRLSRKAVVDALAQRNIKQTGAGRPSKLTPGQKANIRNMYEDGSHNIAELTVLYGISRQTVYRLLEGTMRLKQNERKGNHLLPDETVDMIKQCIRDGFSAYRIGQALSVSEKTVYRIRKQMRDQEGWEIR